MLWASKGVKKSVFILPNATDVKVYMLGHQYGK